MKNLEIKGLEAMSALDATLANGGVDGTTAGTFAVGLGTAVGAGAAFGPVGAAACGIVYSLSFGITAMLAW